MTNIITRSLTNYQKRTTIYFLVVFFFSLLAFTTNASATTYYISNSGSDTNNGTTESTPWKTIAKVNATTTFQPGDNILFKRGDTWRESLTVPSSGAPGNPITYGDYGNGEKPIIDGADVITGMTNTGSNIWQKTGITIQPNLMYLNDTVGIPKTNLTDCTSEGNWYWDSGTSTFYVYSTSDPSGSVELGYRTSLIILTNRTNITLNNLTIQHSNDPWVTGNGAAIRSIGGSDNLVITGCTVQKNGYTGIYITDASNLTFDDNTIINNGGHGLNVVSRYGGESGISFTNNTTNYNRFNNANFVTTNGNLPRLKNVTIHGNSFDNAGEAGLYIHMIDSVNIYNNTIDSNGWSTRDGAEKYAIGVEACSDVNIYENTIENTLGNDASIEVYADTLATSGSANNVKIFRNYFSGAGKFTIHLSGTGNTIRDFEFYYNVVYGSTDWGIALTGTSTEARDTVKIYNNTFYDMEKGAMYAEPKCIVDMKNNIFYTSFAPIIHRSTVEGFLTTSNNIYINTLGGDVLRYPVGSNYTMATIKSLEPTAQTGNPLFTNPANGDFTLQSGSPAINAGTDVGLTEDILGNPIVGLPDIGAYEYQTIITPPPSGGGGGGGGGSTKPKTCSSTETLINNTCKLTSSLTLSEKASTKDVKKDGIIDILDFNIVMVNWNKNYKTETKEYSLSKGDLTGDGLIDIFDINQIMVYWGVKY